MTFAILEAPNIDCGHVAQFSLAVKQPTLKHTLIAPAIVEHHYSPPFLEAIDQLSVEAPSIDLNPSFRLNLVLIFFRADQMVNI